IQALLARGARTDLAHFGNWTALHFAAAHEFVDVVRLLAGAGAPLEALDGDGNTPLGLASRQGNFQVARALIEAGADESVVKRDGICSMVATGARNAGLGNGGSQ